MVEMSETNWHHLQGQFRAKFLLLGFPGKKTLVQVFHSHLHCAYLIISSKILEPTNRSGQTGGYRT